MITPSSARPSLARTAAATAGMLLSHLIALIVLVSVSVTILAQYEAFFRKWDVTVPDLMLLLVKFHWWMNAYWYLLVLGFAPDGIIYFCLARLRSQWNWLAGIWAIVPLLLTIVMLWVVFIGVSVPIHHMATR